jgi:Right handed beta helix region
MLAATCAVAMPAAASATTLWVSSDPVSAPFNSCEHPGYNHIQKALAGPGTAIHVCKGTYAEQLQIERAVTITGYEATVALPATTSDSSTPCDTASQAASQPDQDAVSICGAFKATLKNLTIDAIWPGEPVGEKVSCAYNLNGVLVAGGAELELTGSTVDGAAPQKINGCQYGVGVQVGMSYTAPKSPAKAKLSKDTIDGYQKNGITIEGAGSEATIKTVTVKGTGQTPAIAQNGIGVQLGAKATITAATISGNECNDAPSCGPEAMSQYGADGVYFYEAAAGSSISKSTLDENDVGAEAFDSTEADPAITSDKLEANRWEAVQIAQGSATVNTDVMRDSNVGIQLLQYAEGPFEGQAYAPSGTAAHDTITGMKDWAVLGRSDKSENDLAGVFTITSSKISGNPSGTKPLESVETENPSRLKIYAEKDS